MNVLVLRAEDDASRTAARLRAAGHQPVLSPLLVIKPMQADISGAYDAVIATSAHAFSSLVIPPALTETGVYVVGQRTAALARKAGFSTIAHVAEDAGALADYCLRKENFSSALYLAGLDRKPDLEAALAGFCALKIVETYAAQALAAFAPPAQKMLEDGLLVVALHFSRRSATLFCTLAEAAALQQQAGAMLHIAISNDAAAPLREQGWRVKVAEKADENAVLTALGDSDAKAE